MLSVHGGGGLGIGPNRERRPKLLKSGMNLGISGQPAGSWHVGSFTQSGFSIVGAKAASRMSNSSMKPRAPSSIRPKASQSPAQKVSQPLRAQACSPPAQSFIPEDRKSTR